MFGSDEKSLHICALSINHFYALGAIEIPNRSIFAFIMQSRALFAIKSINPAFASANFCKLDHCVSRFALSSAMQLVSSTKIIFARKINIPRFRSHQTNLLIAPVLNKRTTSRTRRWITRTKFELHYSGEIAAAREIYFPGSIIIEKGSLCLIWFIGCRFSSWDECRPVGRKIRSTPRCSIQLKIILQKLGFAFRGRNGVNERAKSCCWSDNEKKSLTYKNYANDEFTPPEKFQFRRWTSDVFRPREKSSCGIVCANQVTRVNLAWKLDDRMGKKDGNQRRNEGTASITFITLLGPIDITDCFPLFTHRTFQQFANHSDKLEMKNSWQSAKQVFNVWKKGPLHNSVFFLDLLSLFFGPSSVVPLTSCNRRKSVVTNLENFFPNFWKVRGWPNTTTKDHEM